jgi:hypothetical protein
VIFLCLGYIKENKQESCQTEGEYAETGSSSKITEHPGKTEQQSGKDPAYGC